MEDNESMHKSRSYAQFCPYRSRSKDSDEDFSDITSFKNVPIRSDSSSHFISLDSHCVLHDETINEIFDRLYSV